jgi:fructose-specific phosphotransferase system IIC component
MFIGFIAWYVALLALIPFVIAVTFAERNGISAPTWYVVAGAVAGVVGLGLNIGLTAPRGGIRLSDLSVHPVLARFAGATLLAAVAGISAGFAYWLSAVRRALS